MANQALQEARRALYYDRCDNRPTRYTLLEAQRLGGAVEPPNPEDRFTELVRRHLTSSDTALDIGCGDGRWLLSVLAPRAGAVIGLDRGRPGLLHADRKRLEAALDHAGFVQADGRRIPLPDASVTAVTSRRGPLTENETFFCEGCRVLRPGGLALEISIGEQNRRELYQVFGRGQGWGEPERGPRIDRLLATYRAHGLRPIVAEDLITDEYLPGREGVVFQLETTPSVEDFDAVADADLVDEVVARHSTERGVKLTFHRLIIVAKKGAR